RDVGVVGENGPGGGQGDRGIIVNAPVRAGQRLLPDRVIETVVEGENSAVGRTNHALVVEQLGGDVQDFARHVGEDRAGVDQHTVVGRGADDAVALNRDLRTDRDGRVVEAVVTELE